MRQETKPICQSCDKTLAYCDCEPVGHRVEGKVEDGGKTPKTAVNIEPKTSEELLQKIDGYSEIKKVDGEIRLYVNSLGINSYVKLNFIEKLTSNALQEERKIIKLRIDYDRKEKIPAEETIDDLYNSI